MKKRSVRILLTSGAGPGAPGIIGALKAHPFRDVHVIAGDVDEYECAGFRLADEYCILPRADSTRHLDDMLSICAEHRVEILAPVFSGELDQLARNRHEFERNGTALLLPETDAVLTANNKGSFYARLSSAGIAVPAYKHVESLDELLSAVHDMGYPEKTICLKPDRGAGNRGFHVLSERYDRFGAYFNMKPDNTVCSLSDIMPALEKAKTFPGMVVMEFLDGLEYSSDILSGKGEILAMRTRKKLPPEKLGMHFRVEYCRNRAVEELAKSTISVLNASLISSIDVRCDQEGVPRVLELNPRPGAYIGMTCAEINLLAAAVDVLMNETDVDVNAYATGRSVRMGVRYFNDFVVYSDESSHAF